MATDGDGAEMTRPKRFAAQELAALRVDFEKGAALDDLAIGGDHVHMVRLERMGAGEFWGCVYMKDGRTLRLSFGAKGRKIDVIAEWEPS